VIVSLAGGRILRLEADGARDASFGAARFPGLDVGSVAVGVDGKVVAAGIAKTFDDRATGWRDRFGPAVARYLSEPAPGTASPLPVRPNRHGEARLRTGTSVGNARAAG
jgi:hypothetical protein